MHHHLFRRTDWLLGLFILAGCLAVIWVGKLRHDDYHNNQLELSKRSASGTAHEISTYLEELNHRVGLLASTETNALRRLARNPDRESLKKELEAITARHFPDYFAITLATPDGKVLIDDYEGLVGEICQRDLQTFATSSQPYQPFVHPHAEVYHFDVMVRWKEGVDEGIFFISFRLAALIRFLRDSQLHGHELMLLRKNSPGLIELTADGPRNVLKRDFHLSREEFARANSAVPVIGTKWELIALPSAATLKQARHRIDTETIQSLFAVLGIGGFGLLFLRKERGRLDTAQQELTSERNFVGAVLDAADALVLAVGEDGKVVRVNRAFTTLTGLPPEQVIGLPITSLPVFDNAARARLIQQAARPQGSERIEIPVISHNGQVHDIAWSRVLLCDIYSHSEFFIWTGADITYHKRIDRLKTEFISTVSHELRTPLTSIRGALGLLGGGAAGALPPQAKEMVDLATRNSDRLLSLINDLLDIEKMESGGVQLKLETLSPLELVRQTLEGMRNYAQQFSVEINEKHESNGTCVKGDSARLTQVLTNLLSNAIKFSPAGAAVEVHTLRRDGWLRISVSDVGPGIPEAFRNRIFGKFSQADSSDTRAKGGTGLGLAISKALVEMHDGHIGFEPRPGGGTTFYFELPVVPCRTI